MTLKPCPFCGDTPVMRETNFCRVVCIRCDVKGPLAETPERAAELWNRRDET